MRFLVAGFGSIGRRHLENLRRVFPTAPIAIWRRRESGAVVAEHLASPPVTVVFTLDEALKFRPDAAIIAVPTSLHISRAMALAEAGIHLLIEKPISNTLDGVDQLLQTAEKKSLVLMVGYNLRFYEPLHVVKNALEDGCIGRCLGFRCEVGQYLPEWRSGGDYRASTSATAALGGGAILELSHELDYAYWLMGDVKRLSASAASLGFHLDVEDVADIVIEFNSGAIGTVHMDMVQRVPVRYCRIFGDEGTLTCDLINHQVQLYTRTKPTCQTLYENPGFDRNSTYLAELKHFIACINGACEPIVSVPTARQVLQMALAAKTSLKTGCGEIL